MICLNTIFTNGKIAVCRAGLETLHSFHGTLDWKLSYVQILHLTSNLNLKNSADLTLNAKGVSSDSGNSLPPSF